MTKLASIYLRDAAVFVSTLSRTKDGFWVAVGTVHVADAGNVDTIAYAVRIALDGSRHGVPTPPPGEDLTGPMREAAKVKSWSAFVKNAKHILVSLEDGLATLTPYRRVTNRGNYDAQTDKARTCRMGSADFGSTILETLNDAS